MSITQIVRRIAYFYDDKGRFVGKKTFRKTDSLITFQGRKYNINYNATWTYFNRWYWDLEVYQYSLNNPDPFLLNKKGEPLMNSEQYNIQLETKVARDLNDLSKGNFLANLNWKAILIIGGILVLAYLLYTKQIKI